MRLSWLLVRRSWDLALVKGLPKKSEERSLFVSGAGWGTNKMDTHHAGKEGTTWVLLGRRRNYDFLERKFGGRGRWWIRRGGCGIHHWLHLEVTACSHQDMSWPKKVKSLSKMRWPTSLIFVFWVWPKKRADDTSELRSVRDMCTRNNHIPKKRP